MQQQGPCVCGKPLGKHTRRAARRHRDMFTEIEMWAVALGVAATFVRVLRDRGELERLTSGFTEGIRALSQP